MTAAAAVALALLSAAAGALLARLGRHSEPSPGAELSAIAAHTPIGFWTIDGDGVITMATGEGLRRVLGPPERLVGLVATDLLADHPRITARIAEALQGTPASAVAELRGRLLEAHLFPVAGEGGRVAGVYGVAIDVTERYEKEELLHHLADNIAEVIFLASPDLQRFDYVSLGMREVWGRSSEWLTRDGGDWFETVHPEDRTRVREAVADASAGAVECHHRILRPDGVCRWVRTRLFPLRRGSVESLAGIVEDRTLHRKAELELERVRERLADAQRIARLANWDWDMVEDELWWSEGVPEIIGGGVQRSPATLDDALARVHPEDRERVKEALGRARLEGTPFAMTHRVVREDGQTRIVQQRGEVTLDEQGRPIRLMGTVQDITEAHDASQQLAVLSLAVEQSEEDVLIADRDWRILYANPAFERNTGWSLEEVAGRRPAEVLRAEPLDEETARAVESTLAAGRTYRSVFWNQRRDGSRFHEENTITPIRDLSGEVTHYLSTGRDVSQQRRHELMEKGLQEALRKSAEEWRQTFDAVDAAVVVLDANLAVTRLNRVARDLIGRPYGATLGAPLPEHAPEPVASVARLAAEVSSSGRPESTQVVDGQGRAWEISASPALRGAAPPTGAIALLRDVSESQRLQVSLRRSERMSAMGSLVAGVAHEVRNPLFAISATLDAFESEFAGNEDFREYAELLRAEVARLSHLMKELLEYGRPTAADLVPQPLRGSIEKGVRACDRQARAAGVVVEVDLDLNDEPIQVDPPRMIQVIQNVVQNAIDHSPRGGRTRVIARERGDAVECRIEDQGPGFDESDLDRVFDPFFTRRRSGTGLGLSIVQRIVQDHGGEVVPSNRGDEKGAVVTISLPRRRQEAAG